MKKVKNTTTTTNNNNNNDMTFNKILFDERIGVCESSVFQINQTMPPAMQGKLPFFPFRVAFASASLFVFPKTYILTPIHTMLYFTLYTHIYRPRLQSPLGRLLFSRRQGSQAIVGHSIDHSDIDTCLCVFGGGLFCLL